MAAVKLSVLGTTPATTMATGDLIPFTSAPGTTPVSKNITKENFFKYLALSSDADGDMYYRASSLLARLAKGAANLKLFMNAGGTAPEWAKGMIVIASTRDMTANGAPTNVAYTGVGFKPGLLIAFASIPGKTYASWGGVSVAGYDNCLYSYGAATLFSATGKIIALRESVGVTSQDAVLVTFDADGFTLAWTKTGTPTAGTANLAFLILR